MHHKTGSAKQWKSWSAQWVVAAGLGIMASGVSKPVLAQSEITPAGNGRFYVELMDASLFDAIQLVLKAAGNPAANYIVDESAKYAPIPAITFNNVAWDSIIRRLSNEAGFVIRLNPDGTKVVEPRAPVVTDGGEFGGGYPGSDSGGGSSSSGYPGGRGGYPGGGFPGGSSSSSGYPGGRGGYPGGGSSSSGYPGGGLPQNPFGAAGGRRTRRTRPTTETQSSPQTNPALAGGTADDDAGKEYRLIIVRHVYVGGIAQLFANSDIISTEDFLIPESALGGGQNGGGGGFGGGGGGGGFGGGGGGFGGGGLGGGGGGFGGGGGGLGGGGGFGGGGLGGGGGGFGGGGGGLGGGGGGFGGF